MGSGAAATPVSNPFDKYDGVIAGAAASATNTPGQIEPGNIDLNNRPRVNNADGSYSTVRTISTEIDGHTVLLPTIINGKQVSNEEAVKHYRETGEHMGIFDSPESADKYDESLHEAQGWNGPQNSWPEKKPQNTFDQFDKPALLKLGAGPEARGEKTAINAFDRFDTGPLPSDEELARTEPLEGSLYNRPFSPTFDPHVKLEPDPTSLEVLKASAGNFLTATGRGIGTTVKAGTDVFNLPRFGGEQTPSGKMNEPRLTTVLRDDARLLERGTQGTILEASPAAQHSLWSQFAGEAGALPQYIIAGGVGSIALGAAQGYERAKEEAAQMGLEGKEAEDHALAGGAIDATTFAILHGAGAKVAKGLLPEAVLTGERKVTAREAIRFLGGEAGAQQLIFGGQNIAQNKLAKRPALEGAGETAVTALPFTGLSAAELAMSQPRMKPAERTAPESRETLQLQEEAVLAGRQRAMLFPPGTTPLEQPEGLKSIITEAGTFHYDPKRVTGGEILQAVDEGKVGQILGLGQQSKVEALEESAKAGVKPVAVTEETPAGTEVKTAVASPSEAPVTLKAMEKAAKPGNTVRVADPNEVVAERLKGLTAEERARVKAAEEPFTQAYEGQKPKKAPKASAPDYSAMDEEQLVGLHKAGDEKATEELDNRYQAAQQDNSAYSKREAGMAGGVATGEAYRATKQLRETTRNAPRTVVVEDASDLPPRVIAAMEERAHDPKLVKGIYLDGKMYLIAGNLGSGEEAAATWRHEVAHDAIRGRLGSVYGRVLDQFHSLFNTAKDLKANAKLARHYFPEHAGKGDAEVMRALTPEQRREFVEERLARLAEADPASNLWRRFVFQVKKVLNGHLGANFKFNEADARALIERRRTDRLGALESTEGRNAGPRFALKDKEPKFYSQLERVIQGKMPGKASAEQILGLIKGGGVKADEIKWSGIEQFLKGNPNPTKEAVLNYLKTDGSVEVKETVLGEDRKVDDEAYMEARKDGYTFEVDESMGMPIVDIYHEGNTVEPENLPANIEKLYTRYRDSLEKHDSSTVRFADYQTPGGENYREVVFQLPPQELSKTAALRERGWTLSNEGGEDNNFTVRDHGRNIIAQRSTAEAAMAEALSLPGETYKPDYTSSHFPDQPNYLAHARVNDRIAGGKKGLFIEEMQSDRHQQGRKQGYRGQSELTAEEKKELFDLEIKRSTGFPTVQERQRMVELQKKSGLGQIPDAPYRKTEAWTGMVLRRLLAKAVAEGKNWIGWNDGATQAERYDLSKHISRVEYSDNNSGGIGEADLHGEPGSGTLRAWDHSGKRVIEQHLQDPAKLADYIGKDAAEKLLQATPQQKRFAGLGLRSREISGMDLKVGGEGMEGYYDKIVPSVANDIGKRFGARVEKSEVRVNDGKPIDDGAGGLVREPTSQKPIPIWRMDITPEMKKSLETEGQPRFSLKDEEADLHGPGETPKEPIQMPKGPGLVDWKAREEADEAKKQKDLEEVEKGLFKPDVGPREESLFAAPLQGTRRLYLGAADRFLKTPGLEFMGEAMNNWYDYAHRNQGLREAPFRRWLDKYTPSILSPVAKLKARGIRQTAYGEFLTYFQAVDRASEKKPAQAQERSALKKDFGVAVDERSHELAQRNAANILNEASPAGKELIQLWQKAAREMQAENERLKVVVWDDRTQSFRPIGTIQNYFPRSIRPEIRQLMRNPYSNLPEWNQLVRALMNGGFIDTPEKALNYLQSALGNTSEFSYLGNIEAARYVPLPTVLYDYSFNTAMRYIRAHSERTAQIEAFGQKIRRGEQSFGMDSFDVALKRVTNPETAAYLSTIRDQTYGKQNRGAVWDAVAAIGDITAGNQLGNPRTAIYNLLSGVPNNFITFGVKNSLRSLFYDMWRAGNGPLDMIEKGIILDQVDAMVGESDAVRDKSGEMWSPKVPMTVRQRARAYSSFMLEAVGFNAAERFIRRHGMVAEKLFLEDALRQWGKNPNSMASRNYLGFFERNQVDIGKLMAEQGRGPETDRFLRTGLAAAQGGYRINQVPAWTNGQVGRVLFKYFKWGTQMTRQVDLNVIKPLLKPGKVTYFEDDGTARTVSVPHNPLPALRFLLLSSVAGMGARAVNEWLFGVPNPSKSWAQIAMTMDKDGAKALGQVVDKVADAVIANGLLGIANIPLQSFYDFSERKQFRDPLHSANMAIFENSWNFLKDVWDTHSVEGLKQAAEDFAKNTASIVRTTEEAGARLLGAVGVEFDAQRKVLAKQDARWLAVQTRAWSSAMNIPSRRSSPGTGEKSEHSPLFRNINEALLIGDVGQAREVMDAALEGAKSEEERKALVKGIKSSVAGRRPIRAGSSPASPEMQAFFWDWARENLPAGDVERLKQIDDRYQRAARQLEWLSDRPVSERKMEKAREKLRSYQAK